MMNALNLLFHRSTLPLSTLSHCPTDVFQQTLVPSPDSLIPFHSIPTQTSSLFSWSSSKILPFASCLLQFPVNRPPAKPRCPLRCHFFPTSRRNQLVTMPVSQIIADWKQQNATDAVQKIARFAAMFGSVTHSHQPHVT